MGAIVLADIQRDSILALHERLRLRGRPVVMASRRDRLPLFQHHATVAANGVSGVAFLLTLRIYMALDNFLFF